MSQTQLLKLYKALQGETFRQRIQGALIKKAHYILDLPDSSAVDVEFASKVLDNPLSEWEDMVIELSANGTIQENLAIDPSGNLDDRAVPDYDIEYVVGVSWGKVAKKNTQVLD